MLEKYKAKEFYDNNKIIEFYTLENGKTIKKDYEIFAVIKTIVNSKSGFKYYLYTNLENIDEYNLFVKNVDKLKMYNTEIDTEYGDKFITLSTCEYSNKNGRLVIIAKQI